MRTHCACLHSLGQSNGPQELSRYELAQFPLEHYPLCWQILIFITMEATGKVASPSEQGLYHSQPHVAGCECALVDKRFHDG